MANRICSVEDCTKVHQARGLCSTHLQRHYRATRVNLKACEKCDRDFSARWPGTKYCSSECRIAASAAAENAMTAAGLPPIRRTTSLSTAVRQSKWDVVVAELELRCTQSGDCWLWNGALDRRGYGRVGVAGRVVLPHRLAALAANNGELASDLQVHHRCAKPACCNPDHLQVVTAESNLAEMHARQKFQRRIAALESALSDLDPENPLLFNL